MKRIICTVTNDLSYDQRMIRICSTLASEGFKVTLLGRNKNRSIPLKDEVFDQHRFQCIFNKGKWFYLEYNIRLFFWLLFARYDAICSVDLDTIVAGFIASRIRRKILVYDAHELFTELPELIGRDKTKAIWKYVERTVIPKVDAAYTVCNSLKKEFEFRYQVSFDVVRNVPLSNPAPSISSLPQEQPIILLYQGVLNVGRGLEELIDVIAARNDYHLWLAGEGDMSAQLREKVLAMQLSDRITFKGYVAPQELKALTLSCHVGVNLLANQGLNYYYSLANKCFDYIQAGKPAIHMRFPEYQDLQEQYETFVLADDLSFNELNRCLDLIKQPQLYHQMSMRCQEASRILIWENEKKTLIDIYNNVFNT